MTSSKNILLRLSEHVLQEIDTVTEQEGTNRTQFIKTAISFYLQHKRDMQIEAHLMIGYQQMAQINLEYADHCHETEAERLDIYEKTLKEMQ